MANPLNANPLNPSQGPADPAAEGEPDVLGSAAILIVDDEPGMRNFLQRSLEKYCPLVEAVADVSLAGELRRRCHFDLLIVDIRLPDQTGTDWVGELRAEGMNTDVIFITAFADMQTAVEALRLGAADFLLKPFRLEQILSAVRRCIERQQVMRDNILLRRQLDRPVLPIDGMAGSSNAMQEIGSLIKRIAPATSTVVVQGETGTGKELVARTIHEHSDRSGPFVPVNCSSIPSELLASELFGHTKGAFTGAHQAREGLFTFAQRGTLFLDEISEMPLDMQTKLLRALEDRKVRPVGSDREIPVDVRLIAATNQDLTEAVKRGTFREDLYYRINVVSIEVPPLRERLDDIPELVGHFSRGLAGEMGVPAVQLSHRDMVALQGYPWPGNVRELKNVIERSLLLGRLPADCLGGNGNGLGSNERREGVGYPLGWKLAEVERTYILSVLEDANGNKSEAARRLGLSRKTLERKLKLWEGEQSGPV